MRTRAILGSIFASIAVLVVGWEAGGTVATSSSSSTSQPVSGGASASNSTGAPLANGPADGTYTGSSVSTRFGNVQVAVTIAGGAVTDVVALHLTDQDGRSVQISNRAAPILRSEVLAAQSANVSNVSGATYTTRAYESSVQSALDLAGF